ILDPCFGAQELGCVVDELVASVHPEQQLGFGVEFLDERRVRSKWHPAELTPPIFLLIVGDENDWLVFILFREGDKLSPDDVVTVTVRRLLLAFVLETWGNLFLVAFFGLLV